MQDGTTREPPGVICSKHFGTHSQKPNARIATQASQIARFKQLFSAQCELRAGDRGTPLEISLNRGRVQKKFLLAGNQNSAYYPGLC